jgi:hypothetical protein
MLSQSVIVYRSRAVIPLTDIDLFYLLMHARERNEVNDLSGMIIYDRGHFFQWLEGTDQALGQTWNKIRNDARHTDIRVLADQPIPTRLFAGWTMQLAHRDPQHDMVMDGFVVAEPSLLDDLHLNPGKVPNILASFSKLGGSFDKVY